MADMIHVVELRFVGAGVTTHSFQLKADDVVLPVAEIEATPAAKVPAMAEASGLRVARKVAAKPAKTRKAKRVAKPRIKKMALAAYKAHLTMATNAVKGTRGKARKQAIALVETRQAAYDAALAQA